MRAKALSIFAPLILFACDSRAAIHYVNLQSASPLAPYTNWSTAATNIQNAIDAASPGDQVLVTNGVYQTGVVISNAITLQSVNGTNATTIDGAQATSCVTLADGAVLNGFTLANGHAYGGGGANCTSTNAFIFNCLITSNSAWGFYGGGVYFGTLSNCIVSYNTGYDYGGGAAYSTLIHCALSMNVSETGGGADQCLINDSILNGNTAAWGGGADYSTLNNCLVTGNIGYVTNAQQGTVFLGGGLWVCTANNCTIVGNSLGLGFPGSAGGGTYGGTLKNCIIYGNTGVQSNYSTGTFLNCCTAPLPAGGSGNFTNNPSFVNFGSGNFQLQSASPCINAGNNTFVSVTNDLNENSRIAGGTVDVGAYEYQTPTSTLSYVWAQRYGLHTDGTADYQDPDHDGMNNWQEWKSGTIPTSAASALIMAAPSNTASGITVTWQSVINVTYYLQRAANLSIPAAFSTIQTNLTGQTGSTSFADTSTTNAGPYFYRVGVQ